MKDVLVFNTLNSLDFQNIRKNVIRIPEVCARFNEAQDIWDHLDDSGFNFHNFIGAEDEVFLRNIKLKNLAASIAQVGLYDRFLRGYRKPDFMLGAITGDSPFKVCLGQESFEDMILNSQAAKDCLGNDEPQNLSGETLLSGIELTKFCIFKFNSETGQFDPVDSKSKDLENMIIELIEECGVKKLVNIGPGQTSLNAFQNSILNRDVHVLESIEVDPMLNWFWQESQPAEQVAM